MENLTAMVKKKSRCRRVLLESDVAAEATKSANSATVCAVVQQTVVLHEM